MSMNQLNKGNTATGSKKRKSGRFNLIDLIIVVVILLVLATVIYVFAPFRWIQTMVKSETRTIQYTVEITNVDETFIDKIKENDLVVDAVSKNNLGSVSQGVDSHIQYTELGYKIEDNQTTGVLVKYPNRYNLVVTISATADYVEGSGYSVNGCRIAVGEKMFLRFPDYSCEGFCIGLTPM